MDDDKTPLTGAMVNKIESSLDERKSRKERRKADTPLPKALERRTGSERRRTV